MATENVHWFYRELRYRVESWISIMKFYDFPCREKFIPERIMFLQQWPGRLIRLETGWRSICPCLATLKWPQKRSLRPKLPASNAVRHLFGGPTYTDNKFIGKLGCVPFRWHINNLHQDQWSKITRIVEHQRNRWILARVDSSVPLMDRDLSDLGSLILT